MTGFSVVIPVFNGEKSLCAAIRSALEQSYPPCEVIVVDDGSTDGSERAVRSFGEAVRLVRQSNRGASAARNVGIRAATAEWVAMLDDNDSFLSEKLATQAALIERNPSLVAVYSAYRAVSDSGEVRHHAAYPIRDLGRAVRFGSPVLLSSAVFRRAALIEAGMFGERFRICGEWDFWLRFSRTHPAGALAAVEAPLCVHREGRGRHTLHAAARTAETAIIAADAVSDLGPFTAALRKRQILARHYHQASAMAGARYALRSILSWPFPGEGTPWSRYVAASRMVLGAERAGELSLMAERWRRMDAQCRAAAEAERPAARRAVAGIL